MVYFCARGAGSVRLRLGGLVISFLGVRDADMKKPRGLGAAFSEVSLRLAIF